ncbi:MAG TPA: hypothetical protein VHE11_15485 [Steroidobacteraceae bacterium]|nr:hypothetical protein [Steroidobacteraceae bacterium]
MLPQTLDDLVRRHRDRLEIGLATAAELASVSGDVDAVDPPRGRIDGWHIMALRDRVVDSITLHVLGHVEDGRSWITSDVVVLASNRARVRTRNSLYLLGAQATGAPDLRLVLHAAYALRSWGYDERYDLGVLSAVY